MKNLIHNYQQLDHNQLTKTEMPKRNLVTILKEELNIQDQVDLWLIRNPIVDPQQQINLIKQSLENYNDDITKEQCWINYNGELTADDEPTQEEIIHALDDIKQMKEELTPETKRSNFWYITKEYNSKWHYTRYILANGWERIVTDDERKDNPRFDYQRNLSDAREDGDFDTYNKLKQDWNSKQQLRRATPILPDTIEQCFLKIGSKLYGNNNGDAINISTTMLNKKDERTIISYLDMFQCPIKKLIKLWTKIKIVNTNKKTLYTI